MTRPRCFPPVAVAAALALMIGQSATGAHAAATQCIGPAGVGLCTAVDGANACHVSTQIDVTPDVTIDCSGIDVLVEGGGGRLDVAGGVMVLRARNVTVESGRKLVAEESATTRVGIDITATGTVTIEGLLSAKNGGGGTFVSVTAGDAIVLDRSSGKAIETTGTQQAADGGDVLLAAGQTVTVGGIVDAEGKPCCGEANTNSGGTVDIEAGTDVVVSKEIRASGRLFEGGSVRIVAGGDVRVEATPNVITVNGEGTTGSGGDVDIVAGDRLELFGPLSALGGVGSSGGEAGGGTILLTSGCGGILIAGTIDVAAGEHGGGVVVVISDGDIEVSSAIDASGTKDSGHGGEIELDAAGTLVVQSGTSLVAQGHVTQVPFNDGVGGFVDLAGCAVDVAAGSAIDVAGYFGGHVALEGRRDDLSPPTTTSGEFSVRVSEAARLTAVGDTAALDGSIRLRVAQPQEGVCQSDPNVTCTLDASCTVGCSASDCLSANPDTDGQVTQFTPDPLIEEIASSGPCGGGCTASSASAASMTVTRRAAVTEDPKCTSKKLKAAGKVGTCIGVQLGKAAKNGLTAPEASQLATESCLPRLQRKFDGAGSCVGVAGNVEAAENACITSYADDDRGLFTTTDLSHERKVIKTFGRGVGCLLRAHARSPGAPEERRVTKCNLKVLRVISGSAEGAIALERLHACVDGAVELLPTVPVCTSSLDCSDGDPCTADVCVDGLECTHPPTSCPNGGACIAGAGCPCASNADCPDDTDACTVDTCSGGVCGEPVDCDDGDVCTADSCAPTTGCVYGPANEGGSCDDGSACTAGDVCGGGVCMGAPVVCDDGNSCTDDACQPATGCVHPPVTDGLGCDDGSACTMDDTCGGGTCQGILVPPSGPIEFYAYQSGARRVELVILGGPSAGIRHYEIERLQDPPGGPEAPVRILPLEIPPSTRSLTDHGEGRCSVTTMQGCMEDADCPGEACVDLDPTASVDYVLTVVETDGTRTPIAATPIDVGNIGVEVATCDGSQNCQSGTRPANGFTVMNGSSLPLGNQFGFDTARSCTQGNACRCVSPDALMGEPCNPKPPDCDACATEVPCSPGTEDCVCVTPSALTGLPCETDGCTPPCQEREREGWHFGFPEPIGRTFAKLRRTARDPQTNAALGCAEVAVLNPEYAGGTPQLFADRFGIFPLASNLTADARGRFEFYAENDRYDLGIVAGSVFTEIQGVTVWDARAAQTARADAAAAMTLVTGPDPSTPDGDFSVRFERPWYRQSSLGAVQPYRLIANSGINSWALSYNAGWYESDERWELDPKFEKLPEESPLKSRSHRAFFTRVNKETNALEFAVRPSNANKQHETDEPDCRDWEPPIGNPEFNTFLHVSPERTHLQSLQSPVVVREIAGEAGIHAGDVVRHDGTGRLVKTTIAGGELNPFVVVSVPAGGSTVDGPVYVAIAGVARVRAVSPYDFGQALISTSEGLAEASPDEIDDRYVLGYARESDLNTTPTSSVIEVLVR